MQTLIIDEIILRPGTSATAFEQWVIDTDYIACRKLDSVLSFAVYRQDAQHGHSEPPNDSPEVRYLEIIGVSSKEAFAEDTQTSVFKSLVAQFQRMADVVSTNTVHRIGAGYSKAVTTTGASTS